MSKWIDYNAIDYKHYQLHDKSEEFLNGVVYMAECIEEAPSIDIVRCAECKWATETKMKSIEGDVIYLKTCPSRTEVIDDDDFCSYGERREP